MKNSTKLKIRLSKQMFESLAKQVLAEAKKNNMSGGAYTEAVKMPKSKKSPEQKATDGMKKMNEMEFDVAEKLNLSKNSDPNFVHTNPKSVADLAKLMRRIALKLSMMKGIQPKEVEAVGELLQSVLDKVESGDITAAATRADRTFDTATQNIKSGAGVKEDDTMDFQKGAFDVSEMDKKKEMKEADHVTTGAEMAGKDLMGAISSGDPFVTGVALVTLVVAGVLSADKVAKTVKGYYQALTQKDPAKAEKLAGKADEANIDVK